MKKNKSLQSRILFRQKIILALFGIFLSLVILEAGLRLGRFVFLALQEYHNMRAIKQEGVCRIMCLGESTTALGGQDSYPSQLEEALNARNTGIKFLVINKGIPGIHTTAIVENLTDNLNKYNPSIVVTMMGINDQIGYLQYQNPKSGSKNNSLFRQLRIHKLAIFIGMHIKAKINEGAANKTGVSKNSRIISYNFDFGLKYCYAGQEDSLPKEISLKKSLELNSIEDCRYAELGWFYANQSKVFEAEEMFKKALEINPKNDNAFIGLGACYLRKENFIQAEELYKKALIINPKNDAAYVGLGFCCNSRSKLSEAEKVFKKALEINPKNDNAYLGLGWCYKLQATDVKNAQAEEAFNKALALNINNYYTCIDVGFFYSAAGNFIQAERLYKKAIEINPGSDTAYNGLGFCYLSQLKLAEAEEAFKKAIEINPKNDKSFGGLAIVYENEGKFESAKKYYQKGNGIRTEYYPVFYDSYPKLKEILDHRGMKLVCVQYPNRDVEPLRKIFAGQKGIIFVDNEKIFKDALKKGSYKDYFSDMFAGDFGHCTPRGNRLLAENIANAILREVFDNLIK